LKLYQLNYSGHKLDFFVSDTELTSDLKKDIENDALLRDFTEGAIYLDKDGKIYDPLGGIDDTRILYLKSDGTLDDPRILRMTGDPLKRLTEDPRRALRALYKKITLPAEFEPGLEDAMGAFIVPPDNFKSVEYINHIDRFTKNIFGKLQSASQKNAFLEGMKHYHLEKLYNTKEISQTITWIALSPSAKDEEIRLKM
jgi:hypothetical protein